MPRYPRNLEAFLDREMGTDCLQSMLYSSHGLKKEIPIMGVGLAAYDGTIVKRDDTAKAKALYRKNMSWKKRLLSQRGTGFASLSDLIAEATAGKIQTDVYNQVGTTGVVATTNSLWNTGTLPAAGGTGGAAPGGTIPTNTTTGAHKFTSPAGSDTLHLTTWAGQPTVAGMSLMLADRLWFCTYNHASSTSTAITGVPTRYQGTDAAGSFISNEVTTALSATAHTMTITYMDQDGNSAEAGAALAVRVSSAANQVGFTTPNWFYPLNAGDYGVRKITNIAQSTTASVTGVTNQYIGHPIAILPQPRANDVYILDGINSAFNLVEVKPTACLFLLEFNKSATTATTYTGTIQFVSG